MRAFGHPGKIVAAVIITLHNIGGKTLKYRYGNRKVCVYEKVVMLLREHVL